MPQRYTKDTILSQILTGKNEVENCSKSQHQAWVSSQSACLSGLTWKCTFICLYLQIMIFFFSPRICGVWKCFPLQEGFWFILLSFRKCGLASTWHRSSQLQQAYIPQSLPCTAVLFLPRTIDIYRLQPSTPLSSMYSAWSGLAIPRSERDITSSACQWVCFLVGSFTLSCNANGQDRGSSSLDFPYHSLFSTLPQPRNSCWPSSASCSNTHLTLNFSG